jgi:hypothetical protein
MVTKIHYTNRIWSQAEFFFNLWILLCLTCHPKKQKFQAGIALGELRSLGDLYDFQSIATLFFIGIISVTPTLVGNNQSEEENRSEPVIKSNWYHSYILLPSVSLYIPRASVWLWESQKKKNNGKIDGWNGINFIGWSVDRIGPVEI